MTSGFIQTPTGSAFPPPGGRVRLASPQYGPAWVADCYGTTHAQRLRAVLGEARRTGRPVGEATTPDQVAVAYARLRGNQSTGSLDAEGGAGEREA